MVVMTARLSADVISSRRTAMRFMKNSSRLEVKIARNFARSSNGVRGSCASANTRRLKSSHPWSRSIQTSSRPHLPGAGAASPPSTGVAATSTMSALAEAAGDVALGALVVGVGEDVAGQVVLDQRARAQRERRVDLGGEERRAVAHAGRLL